MLIVIQLLALSIPLARLEDQHTHEDQDENGVTCGHDLQTILPAQHDLTRQRPLVPFLESSIGPDIAGNGPQALDNIGDIDADPDDEQHERGAVKEHVALGRLEQLDEEAQEADGHDDVQQAGDQRRRLVQELEVDLELVKEGGRDRVGGPEEGVVVGELGKDDAQEEADS